MLLLLAFMINKITTITKAITKIVILAGFEKGNKSSQDLHCPFE